MFVLLKWTAYISILFHSSHSIDLTDKLAPKIRELRYFMGYSQEYVAFKLNRTQAAYSKIELGKTQLSIDTAEQIATLYNITVTDLISQNATYLVRLLVNNPTFRCHDD